MKILYLAKFRFPHSTENYVTHALRTAGVEVKRISYSTPTDEVIERIHNFVPDVVLFSKVQVDRCRDLIDLCRRLEILTVCWQWDLFFGYRSHRPEQFKSDLLFATDGGHQDGWNQYNYEVLRQGIHEPGHLKYDSSRCSGLAFVGGIEGHPSRAILLNWLKKTYPDNYTHVKNCRGTNLNKVLAGTSVIVGDSFPGDYYWSNRIYEITGRGGFLLHPETVGLDEEFTDGEHYVSYKRGDFHQLKVLIDHYLEDHDHRERIRDAGFHHTGRNYTYQDRVRILLQRIESRLNKKTLT